MAVFIVSFLIFFWKTPMQCATRRIAIEINCQLCDKFVCIAHYSTKPRFIPLIWQDLWVCYSLFKLGAKAPNKEHNECVRTYIILKETFVFFVEIGE